jgi:membrane protein implicated in regulation of membrane protease activity
MDEPEQWRWIWLGVAVVFGIGEMASPGSFFLAPFAIGAAVAAILAFADVPILGEWVAFLAISVGSFVALRPLARKLDAQGSSDGVGARRLIGRTGIVLEDIAVGAMGMVRVDREDWRAEAPGSSVLPAGTAVRVAEVEGTRVIVTPVESSKEHGS